MGKVYHLQNCTTCQRILKEVDSNAKLTKQEIKSEPITTAQIDEMAKLAGSYEALFSRRAMKYRALGLNEKTLSEKEYRNYILEEYTFLKRPVFLIENEIFVGNTKKVVAQVKAALE